MSTTLTISSLREHLRSSGRILLKELGAFGIVGAIAFVIDMGGFALLVSLDIGPVVSTVISAVLATIFAYFGNRYWSFSHRARQSVGRETSFFFGINAIALLFSAVAVAFVAYPLDHKYDDHIMSMVKFVTIGLGTVFRFWAYKRFVFLHPDRVHSFPVNLDEELAEQA